MADKGPYRGVYKIINESEVDVDVYLPEINCDEIISHPVRT